MYKHLSLLIKFVCLFVISTSVARTETLVINPHEKGSSIFADQEVKLSFTLHGLPQWQGIAEWRLKARNKIIGRGDQFITPDKSNNYTFNIVLHTPVVKPQLIVDSALEIIFIHDKTKEEFIFEKKLSIFGNNPFALHNAWLRDLNIYLYDPIGDTEKVLYEAGIPLKRINNLDRALAGFKGLLIIGEAVSIADREVLKLLQLADSGTSVLCLSLTDTNFPMKFQILNNGRPGELIFSDHTVIKRLNNKLDSVGWTNTNNLVSSSVSIQGDRSGVRMSVQQGEAGWPWMEMSFTNQKSKLVFAGFPIIKNWNQSPVPRFLFKELLNYVSGSKNAENKHEQ